MCITGRTKSILVNYVAEDTQYLLNTFPPSGQSYVNLIKVLY